MTAKKTPATAAELYTLTQQAKSLAYQLQRKYYRQEIQYKTIGASHTAIKANARRQELAKQLMQVLSQYEHVVFKKMQKEYKERRHVQFTIYPNGRR